MRYPVHRAAGEPLLRPRGPVKGSAWKCLAWMPEGLGETPVPGNAGNMAVPGKCLADCLFASRILAPQPRVPEHLSSVSPKTLLPTAQASQRPQEGQLEINKVLGPARLEGSPLCFFKYSWLWGSSESHRGSDGDPHCVHLVLESQQAIGNAFLVSRQPHPNPLDVIVGHLHHLLDGRVASC